MIEPKTHVHPIDRPDIAAVRALVDALPKCSIFDCDSTATRTANYGEGGDANYCEADAPAHAGDLPYGAALRALLERMKSWE